MALDFKSVLRPARPVLLRVRRDDPAEALLVWMLLGSESDLAGQNEPIAFPVFGRGRVLYALVGDGITADNVRTAGAFLGDEPGAHQHLDMARHRLERDGKRLGELRYHEVATVEPALTQLRAAGVALVGEAIVRG